MSDVTQEGTRVLVKPGQDIVAATAGGLREELKGLANGAIKELVVDLAGVEMVDSIGIGLLVSAHNSLHKVGGKLIIINASKNLYDLFKHMRLDQHFEVIMAES